MSTVKQKSENREMEWRYSFTMQKKKKGESTKDLLRDMKNREVPTLA